MARLTNAQKTIVNWLQAEVGHGGDVTITRIHEFFFTSTEMKPGWDNGPYDCVTPENGESTLTIRFDAVYADTKANGRLAGTPYWQTETNLTNERLGSVADLLNALMGIGQGVQTA